MATNKVDSIDFSSAVNAARAQAKLHKPFVDLADALERIGSLDNAKKENEQAIALLSEEKLKIDGEVKKLKAKLNSGLASIESEIKSVKDAAALELSNAKHEALNIIEAAKAKSASNIANADLKAESILNVAALKLKEQEALTKQSADECAALIASADAAIAELDNINLKLNQAKAKVAGLLE